MGCIRNIRTIAIFCFPVLLSIMVNGQSAVPESASKKIPQFVSIVSLLATPQKFDGKLVRVMGVLGVGHESDALYLHEEDYAFSLTKNSFRLHLTEEEERKYRALDNRHVIVEGIFSANGPDAREMTSGAILNISRLDGWGPLEGVKR